jgi:Calcium-activated chloride channel
VLIRFPVDVLRKYAFNSQFTMALDPLVCEDKCAEGDKGRLIAPIFIPYDEKTCKYHPFLYMYGKYVPTVPEELYWKPEEASDPFRPILRIKLTKLLIQGPVGLGGGNLLLSRLVEKGVLLGAFPMHDAVQRKKILHECIHPLTMPWAFPFADMNEYFGEKLSLYFVFMSTYSVFLIFPAIVGAVIQLLVFTNGNYSHWTVSVFAAYLAGWALTFTENVQHVEAVMAMRWGTCSFETVDEERGEYVGKEIMSPVTGRVYIEGDPIEKKKKFKDSVVFMFVTCSLSVVVVAVVYLFRYYLYHKDEIPSSGIDSQRVGDKDPGGFKSTTSKLALQYASCVNAFQIQVFNVLFTGLAVRLTEAENHRTEDKFEASLVAKIFIFMAINSFTSFIYLAFCFPFELEVDIFYNYDVAVPNITMIEIPPGKFLLICICNFHVLSHLLLIYVCKLHWNLNRSTDRE